jgi:hypothetical protein
MKWRNADMVKDFAEIVKSFLEIILKGFEVNAKFLGKGQIPIEILAVERSSLSDTDIQSLKILKSSIRATGILVPLIVSIISISFIFLDPSISIIARLLIFGLILFTIPISALFFMKPDNIRAPKAALLGRASCYDDFFNAILTSLASEGWESTDWSKKTGCIKVCRSEHYFSSVYEMNLQVSALPDNSYKLDIEGLNPKTRKTSDIYSNSKNVYKFLTRFQALSISSFKEKTSGKELS